MPGLEVGFLQWCCFLCCWEDALINSLSTYNFGVVKPTVSSFPYLPQRRQCVAPISMVGLVQFNRDGGYGEGVTVDSIRMMRYLCRVGAMVGQIRIGMGLRMQQMWGRTNTDMSVVLRLTPVFAAASIRDPIWNPAIHGAFRGGDIMHRPAVLVVFSFSVVVPKTYYGCRAMHVVALSFV